MQLEGRNAIITGAASGLGRATAEVLHAAGANVVLLDLEQERLDALATGLGEGALAMATDVCDAAQVGAAITMLLEHFGDPHIVVNCAGIAPPMKTVSKGVAHDLELWRRVIDINLTGTFNVMRLVAAQMSGNEPDAGTGERGVIINTASGAAYDGQRGQAAYAASKAAIVGLALPVARDLNDLAIRCLAIAPGLFDTSMMAGLPEKAVTAIKHDLLYPDRFGEPAEFAALVKHVVENAYLNGTCLRLDGGLRLAGPA